MCIRDRESINAGYIDLAKLQLGTSVDLSIELPDGLRNIDSVQKVTVSFNTMGFTTRTISVSEIRVVNAASGTTVTPSVGRINNMTLIGREDELAELSESSVVAQIDASPTNVSVTKGQQNMEVEIIVPGTETVFATGTYTVPVSYTHLDQRGSGYFCCFLHHQLPGSDG